jgi:hypothetical protein
MDAVAFAATIGGSIVGLAGVLVGAWGISQQRASGRELADCSTSTSVNWHGVRGCSIVALRSTKKCWHSSRSGRNALKQQNAL